MQTKIKYISILVLAIMALSLFGAGTRSVEAANNEVLKEKPLTLAQQKASLAFWSRESVISATPMVMIDYGSPEVDASALGPIEGVGIPGFSASGMAAPGANQKAREFYSSDWQAIEKSGVGIEAGEPEGTSGVYTSYMVNQWTPAQTIYPHKWVGRFSFNSGSGTSYCSATSISNNHILTAAHCVFNTATNVFYTSKVFQPAYRNGNAPYGTFPTAGCTVLTTYVNLSGGYNINTWAPHDVAICKMGTNTAGQTLNNAVGWMGRQWNQSYVRHFHTLGYPFRDTNDVLLPNAGLYLRTCAAESRQQAAEVLGMGCNLSRGISGGPWMTAYAPNVVSGFANSVNSGFFIGQANLYGARFNSNNIVVLCNASVC